MVRARRWFLALNLAVLAILALALPALAATTEETGPQMPHVHYVNMTRSVAQCREDMYRSLHGGRIG